MPGHTLGRLTGTKGAQLVTDMLTRDELRNSLGAAVGDAGTGLLAADRLCNACVDLLEADGADISFTHAGSTQGTFGSSGAPSRRLDDYQFTGWEQLASLERIEVYQATGTLMGQLEIGPVEALVRLRAHAFATGQTASDVASDIVEGRVSWTTERKGRPHER
jgi:hypothetical protein